MEIRKEKIKLGRREIKRSVKRKLEKRREKMELKRRGEVKIKENKKKLVT